MFKRFLIVHTLFKNSFFLMFFLYFFTLVFFATVLLLKDAYKTSLQNEFATKQPHIKIQYINNHISLNPKEIQKDKKSISSISSQIKSVASYVQGESFVHSLGYKISGNAQYNGNVKIIGLDREVFVYDFFSAQFMKHQPFEVEYTPISFVYKWRTQENIAIFNETLFHSYFPIIESTEKFEFRNEYGTFRLKLASVFHDYDKSAILYTTIPFANQLLHNTKDTIDGYYVNTYHLYEIENITRLLKEKLPHDRFLVSSWLETRDKQMKMFTLYDTLSVIIECVIVFLSILFILLLLYNAIIKKSYQLSVLHTLGFILKKEIFLYCSFLLFVTTIIVAISIVVFGQTIVSLFALPFTNIMLFESLIAIFFLGIVFLIVSFIMISNAYKIKAKSVF